NPNVVKVVGSPVAPRRLRALYFTRATAPSGEGPLYHHIGLYAYRRSALERFVGLPPSPLEQRERLEQLRALEAGMRIDVTIVDRVPLGGATPEDLEIAGKLLQKKSSIPRKRSVYPASRPADKPDKNVDEESHVASFAPVRCCPVRCSAGHRDALGRP